MLVPDVGKYLVKNRERCGTRWDVKSHLRHEHNQADCFDDNRFASRIWSTDREVFATRG